MLNRSDILSTIDMIDNQHLDIRTTTMGISLLDCADTDIQKCAEKVYDKITKKAENLVKVGCEIEKEFGIPIVNKRISVTPISLVAAACRTNDYTPIAKALDRAARTCGVNFIGGFSALVQKGFTESDKKLIDSIPQALAETQFLCSSVNVASTKAGINMDAVKRMGETVKKTAELTKDSGGMGCAKLVIFDDLGAERGTDYALEKVYNIIDTRVAAARGIVVTNIPAYSTESVAQMVFAHLLNITNRVGEYALQNRAGRWSRSADFCYWDAPLVELSGKHMGIVGLGHTGQATARIAQAFGLTVCAYTSKAVEQLPGYIHKASLDELFSECDIVSLHCPLNEQTFHLVDAERLKMMKPSAILINTGRGPLVDEQAVAEALNEGRLAAFGADVLDVEPARADNPLLTARNSFLTPHIAWATYEARKRLLDICVENVAAFMAGAPIHVVA